MTISGPTALRIRFPFSPSQIPKWPVRCYRGDNSEGLGPSHPYFGPAKPCMPFTRFGQPYTSQGSHLQGSSARTSKAPPWLLEESCQEPRRSGQTKEDRKKKASTSTPPLSLTCPSGLVTLPQVSLVIISGISPWSDCQILVSAMPPDSLIRRIC
jgi:hypothetical protein